jgi:hypothetical protein
MIKEAFKNRKCNKQTPQTDKLPSNWSSFERKKERYAPVSRKTNF